MNEAKHIYEYFWVSVMLKGGISALEVVAGVAALLLRPEQLDTILYFFTQELYENPGGFFAVYLLPLMHASSASFQIFAAAYLISRGVIKLGLVAALLKDKIWAYPLSLLILGMFVVFQAYEIVTRHSILITLVTLFDLVVIYYIYREYEVVRSRVTRPAA